MGVKYYSSADIEQLEEFYRRRLINSLTGYKNPFLVGTISKTKNENLAIFSSVFHLGANPALLGMVCRPHTVRRDTLENILETKKYTLNLVEETFYKEAHQTSARYKADESEFAATGLNPEYKENFLAPYVAESSVQIGMTFLESLQINYNQTQIIIGKVESLFINESLLAADGHIAFENSNAVCVSDLDTYYSPKRISRLSYAKPNKKL